MKRLIAFIAIFCIFTCMPVIALSIDAQAESQLRRGESLRAGQFLISPDSRYLLAMQDDGNLVIYRLRSVWSSNTVDSGAVRLDMQGDGNLVLYDHGGRPVWDSGSTGRNRTRRVVLRIQDDGNLVIYRNRKPIWSSRDGRHY